MVRTVLATCVMAALTVGFITSTSASTFDRTTYFTFSQPVAIPGVTLPAGTYLFRLADPGSGRRIINVQDRAGRHSYAMFHTIPTWRADVPREPEVSFMETASDMPPAVKTIWYQGEHNGLEFIYPREQLRRLTRGGSLASSSPRVEPAEAESDPVVRSEPVRAEDADAPEADAPAYTVADGASDQPNAADAQSSPVVISQAEPSSSEVAREALPRTASAIPIALLLGVGTVLGGLWLKKKR